MITLTNITLQRGIKILLQDVSIAFFANQKIGIIGKNGCGKTSLFLLLLGTLEASAGEIKLPAKLSVITVEQEIPNATKPAIEYVIDADLVLRDFESALQQAEKDKDAIKIAQLYEAIQHREGFTAKTRAAKILDGLGFDEEQMQQSVNDLSGGWRMRLNIARAIFVPSDVLLLDEPTNHLDLDAVIWLETWLQKYQGLLLLISHDREFLDHITTHTAHFEQQQIKFYVGNYSSFEQQRAEAFALQQKQYEKQQKQITHIQSFINRFKAKATKARQAQSRIKALERMQKIMPAHIDSPFTFEFKEPNDLSSPLIVLNKISFAYEDNLVLNKISFQLNAEDRIGLLGKNGAGKSTFIKLLAGSLICTQGTIMKNAKVKVGYFAQHTLDLLFAEKNALEHLQQLAPNESELILRKFLGGFNFSGDMTLMPIKNFSGGEKARLALAVIIWQAPNVLLLDEPTNHLDMDMRQALILALQSYEGAVVIVSHDRFLLNQVDNYYLIANKTVQKFDGNLNDYQTWLMQQKSLPVYDKEKKRLEQNLAAENKKLTTLKNQQIKNLEKKMSQLQQEINKLDHKLIVLAVDPAKNLEEIKSLQLKRSQTAAECEKCEELWLREI
jgi:ATP-binding cassette, subfamily F, member 3